MSKWFFCTTNPSELRVMAAALSGAAADSSAFETFCNRYFGPVYGVIRLRHSPERAQELTQKFFFKHFVEKNVAAGFEPERGRFRNWLWRQIQWFVRTEHAQLVHDSMLHKPYDVEEAEQCHQKLVQRGAGEQSQFEWQYAAALARDAVRTLQARWQQKFDKRGKQIDAEVVVAWLVDRDYEAIARILEVPSVVARKTVQRINEDLWKALATRVRETVSTADDFAAEFEHVCSVLGIAPPKRLLAR